MLIAIVGAFPNFGTRSMSDKFSFPKQSQASFEFEQLELLFRLTPLKSSRLIVSLMPKNTGKYYTNMKQQKNVGKTLDRSAKSKTNKSMFQFLCLDVRLFRIYLTLWIHSKFIKPKSKQNRNSGIPNRKTIRQERENNSKQPSSRSSTWRMNAIF